MRVVERFMKLAAPELVQTLRHLVQEWVIMPFNSLKNKHKDSELGKKASSGFQKMKTKTVEFFTNFEEALSKSCKFTLWLDKFDDWLYGESASKPKYLSLQEYDQALEEAPELDEAEKTDLFEQLSPKDQKKVQARSHAE